MNFKLAFVLSASLLACVGCDKPAAPIAAKPAASGGSVSPTADGKEVVITDANFEAEVLKSRQPVLVDIWATWCPPCRKAGPTIEALAKEYAGKVKVGKLDADANPHIAGQYAPTGIPVFMVFKDGKLIHKAIGFDSDEQLRAELRPALETVLK